MSQVAIRCEGLSKQYRIGKRERYRDLRDVLTDAMSAPFRALRSAIRNSDRAIRNSQFFFRNGIPRPDKISPCLPCFKSIR